MADPLFPRRGGAQPLSLEQKKLLFWQDFAKNGMAMKEIEPGAEGGAPLAPSWLPQ